MPSDLLDDLNPQQREAVEITEGPLLILAGAGSGKTRVITYRIAHLIDEKQVKPESILAVTFTNKAAQQMKERVARLITRSLQIWPHISTFHSFCVRVLRGHAERIGYRRDFSIYDEDDQQRIAKLSIEELGLGNMGITPRAALARISFAKNRGATPQVLYGDAADAWAERLAAVFDRYEKKLKAANALDFDDLLLKTVELFYQAPDVAESFNRRFRYVLVDEYQDTNRIQYQLIRQLTLLHQNLCVVGDEDQSIYRWRGADIQNILSFERDYPQARLIRLEQNYRSTQQILDAATAVVSRNVARKGKTLWTDRGAGDRVGLFEARDAEDEAIFVAKAIQAELARPGGLAQEGKASVAVLYRTNAQSRVFEEALRAAGVDYRVVGGLSFYARAEVKDALAYARLAVNPEDNAAFLRIINTPPRGIGQATVETLAEAARAGGVGLFRALERELEANRLPPRPEPARFGARALRALEGFREIMRELTHLLGAASSARGVPLAEFFREMLERSGLLRSLGEERTPESEARIENLKELAAAAAEAEDRGETLAEFLDHAVLVSDADNYDERARVTLMTLHSAKGLEFSTVFLAGLEEGLFPHKLSLDDDAGVEEERRLCYVGMTRARDRLILSWANGRRAFAREGTEATRPSRFLAEIPAGLVEAVSSTGGGARPRTRWENAVNSIAEVDSFFKLRSQEGKPMRRTKGLTFVNPRRESRWKLGTKVRHPKYGLGTIVECDGEGVDAKLTISFPGYGLKKLIERYASLEKV